MYYFRLMFYLNPLKILLKNQVLDIISEDAEVHRDKLICPKLCN